MTKKNIEMKNKIVNHLVIKGKKSKSEAILLKSLKTLQISSNKSSKKLFQLALVSSTPIFKVNTIIQKKRKKKKQKAKIIPAFISNKKSRASFAIKLILKNAIKRKGNSLFQEITNEILMSSQNKSQTLEAKKESQKQVLLNRHLFKYYRWH
jgi:small subunit ribosomal protein S7